MRRSILLVYIFYSLSFGKEQWKKKGRGRWWAVANGGDSAAALFSKQRGEGRGGREGGESREWN